MPAESVIERLKRLEAEATKGPWYWTVSLATKQCYLQGNPSKGRETVMDFVRWGMGGAAPRFRNDQCLMVDVKELAVPVSGREHHANWYREIDHPDARLIAEVRNALPLLLRVAEAAEARVDAVRAVADAGQVAWDDPVYAAVAKADEAIWSAVRALRAGGSDV